MNILITGAGGAAAISVWKSLGDENRVYMADIDPNAAGLYLVPAKQRALIPPGDSTEFIPHLVHRCQEFAIDVLIPTVDVELLPIAKQKKQFTDIGTKIPLSSATCLERCRDKYQLLSHCQDTGLTPYFTLLSEETVFEKRQFPCFAKPRFGAGSRGAMIIDNLEALHQLPKDNSYLIQEYLPGEEYSVDVYIQSDGVPIAAVPRLRLKVDSGIAVACQTKINTDLSDKAITIAKTAEILYVANIQFKQDAQGQFKLLEINPRFPGTLPLTMAAGVNIPQLMLLDLYGHHLGYRLLPFEELMVVRYWTEQYFRIEEWQALCPPP